MPNDKLPILYVPRDAEHEPDDAVWTNKFIIKSETSGRKYAISQHKKNRHWGCGCPAWRTRRRCKHLDALMLPGGERPYEVQIEG